MNSNCSQALNKWYEAVEKCGKRVGFVSAEYTSAVSACSACAGDYEDPDRTARDEEEWSEEGWDLEDFPAGRQFRRNEEERWGQ